jgi:hypothetical protein
MKQSLRGLGDIQGTNILPVMGIKSERMQGSCLAYSQNQSFAAVIC